MLVEIERFVNWVRRRSPEAHTWRDYRCDLNFFMESVGDRPAGEITFRDVDTFIGQQAEKGFKATTINRRLASVVALYAFLSPEDDDLVCPVFPHRHHLREPQHLPRPVQEDELRRFFAVITDLRDRAAFLLMLRCGLRISEAANLRLADLYLDEPYPRLVTRGKGSRERAVYLSPQAELALREYLATRPSVASDFVFLTYQNKQFTSHAIHLRLMRYREQSAISITAHRLRHSFANDLVNADVPVTSIQKLLGHRWIETTQTYVMANDHQVRADYFAACQKLEGWALSPKGML
ncbi:MAG: tyrosine-type recombinase/integrase [Anaerolineales bacterium]